jgi:uncharacterized membrane protein YbhN (UPF0104 family)
MLYVRAFVGLTVAVCLMKSFLSAREALTRDPSFTLRAMDVRWLCLGGALYFVGLLPMCAYWHYLNAALGQLAPPLRTTRAYYIGHLGKYVPGKAMAIVLRAAFLRGANVSPSVVALSVFIETFTMMATAAGISAALIGWHFAERQPLLLMAIGLLAFSSVPTWPPIVRFCARRMRIGGWGQEVETALRGYTWRVMLVGWLMEMAGWTVIGFSLWAVLRAMPLPEPLDSPWILWPRLTASVGLSMVVGFVSLLPGGLGAREWILNELLQEPFGPIVAPLSAVLLRFVWLLTELVASIILYLGHRRPGA